MEIRKNKVKHKLNKYFSVIAIRTSSKSREISEWTQPIIEEPNVGFTGFIIKRINL